MFIYQINVIIHHLDQKNKKIEKLFFLHMFFTYNFYFTLSSQTVFSVMRSCYFWLNNVEKNHIFDFFENVSYIKHYYHKYM